MEGVRAEEAEKHAAEDKVRMERVDAKNQLEAYLYNTRNAVREDKVKESLGADTVKEVEAWVQEGIDWLEAHQDAEKAEFDEKQKMYEEKIRPVMTKMYENAGSPGANPSAPSTDAQPSANASPSAPPRGPSVEEVD